MSEQFLILHGAGNCGRSIARNLKEPFVFTDNDWSKVGTKMMGVSVMSPGEAQLMFPNATWVVAIGKPERKEVAAQLTEMGVKFEMPWKYLDMKMGLPSVETGAFVIQLAGDTQTVKEFTDQFSFRTNPDYDQQLPCDDMRDIYWPDFITRLDSEVLWDCGAADADTVIEFISRWPKFSQILAIEPDAGTFEKLKEAVRPMEGDILVRCSAVSDHNGVIRFVCNGDYSSHVEREDSTGLGRKTCVDKLDSIDKGWSERLGEWGITKPPTFIKMDIESSEPAALWGARKTLRDHKPVLAICAYHESDHLWTLPLLIHALQPEYKLFLRRYSPGTLDLVWYAVPPERIKR